MTESEENTSKTQAMKDDKKQTLETEAVQKTVGKEERGAKTCGKRSFKFEDII
jgi:hypothetical protein